MDFIHEERQQGKVIYPETDRIFFALKATPYESVRVVILGQDPYHGPNQAQGLCFSVPTGLRLPPSLRNIYQELKNDLGIEKNTRNGCLLSWAQQGVLLLNTVLTVEAGCAQSHAHIGWPVFTDCVIECLNAHAHGIVFMLWGQQAQNKISKIDATKHLILQAAHPSPLSAHKGFFGCRHFSQANAWLMRHERGLIDWSQ